MIVFDQVSKSFVSPGGEEVVIVQDVSREVGAGEFVALMGPSGAGKSTVLNLVAGLVQQQQGRVVVHGTDLSPLTVDERTQFRGKHISFVFQQFHLLPQLTVADNVDLVIELNGLERRYATAAILDKVGLSGRGEDYPGTLSGGEQQRVAIARAFVAETPVLLADEPTGNLDYNNARAIMDLMVTLHEEVGNTIVMISHDREIAAFADRIYRLQDHGLVLVS